MSEASLTPEIIAAAERLLKSAMIAGKGEPHRTRTAYKAVYEKSGFTRIEDEKTLAHHILATARPMRGDCETKELPQPQEQQ